MAKQLTKSHITQLSKVATQLALQQKMNYTQLIMKEENQKRFKEAEELIYKAMSILRDVK